MNKKELLNEESYQKNKTKLTFISVLILIIGLLIGIALIILGVQKINKANYKYSEEAKQEVTEMLNSEQEILEQAKYNLELEGYEYNYSATYVNKGEYDLKVITNVLDPSFNYCSFDEYSNNLLTSNYCSIKNDLNDLNSEFEKNYEKFLTIPFFMIAFFVIAASCTIFSFLYMTSKRREIAAFGVQQMRPIASEGIEKMVPSIGKAAEEITKGVKKGLNK